MCVSRSRTLWKHAFKNAVIIILTGIPTLAGIGISNMIVVEVLGNLQGIGRLVAMEFARAYASPNLIASVAICFAAMFAVVDSMVDALLLWLDPRAGDFRMEERLAVHNRRETDRRMGLGARLKAIALAPVEVLVGLGAFCLAVLQLMWEYARALTWHGVKASFGHAASHYRRNIPLAAGTLLVGALVLVTVFGPSLVRHDPNELRVIHRVGSEFRVPPFPPSAEFPLGSDELGRDLLSRVIHGARWTLLFRGARGACPAGARACARADRRLAGRRLGALRAPVGRAVRRGA